MVSKVGGTLSVDRKGVANTGVSGQCDGVFGGEDGSGPPPPCNGKASFAATIYVEYLPDGRLSGHRMPTEDIAGNRGLDCPLEVGPRSMGPLEMMWAFDGKADPTKAGDPGKYIVILRDKRTDTIPGGSIKTSVTYTVTFRKLG